MVGGDVGAMCFFCFLSLYPSLTLFSLVSLPEMFPFL